jgi:tetratricopeptide (TPR) repeat protein
MLFSGNTFAQASRIEVLRAQIQKETNDTSKIKFLIQLGLNYSQIDPDLDSCLAVAYRLSKQKNYTYGLIFGRFYESLVLSHAGRYDEAIDKCKRCIEELDSMHVIQNSWFPLSVIRILFNLAGKQAEKFKYYSEKATYYKRYGPIENIADCYHGIAGYYLSLADYDKAIECYMRAQGVYKSFDPFGYATAVAVIGETYLLWGNLEKAQQYLESALKEYLPVYDIPTIAYCYNNLGDVFLQRHDYHRALAYYYMEKKYWPELAPQYIAKNMLSIAVVHLQQNNLDSAFIYLTMLEKMRQKGKLAILSNHSPLEIDYYWYMYFTATGEHVRAMNSLKAALNEATSSKYLPLVMKYTNELHSYLLKKGDSIQAFRYVIQYQLLQDSLNKMNTQARIASFEIEQQQQAKENEIEHLQAQKKEQRNYYLVCGAFLLMIVTAAISLILYRRKRDKERLTSDFKNQLAQAETKALRAQMNPHFIFNSLNSINSFVMDQQHELASEYLIKFSKLIRLILDNSRSETISIEKELETLKLYVLLEAARFDNKFKCVYHIAGDVNTSSIMIPPMLLQPFVENAIWHGLMQKEGEGTITIELSLRNEELIIITIEDDGIGREKAAELKSKSATHKSHGLKVTSQRIEMINKLNTSGAQVQIIDLMDEQGQARGTRVELVIPV